MGDVEEIQNNDVNTEVSKRKLINWKVKLLFSLSGFFIVLGFYKRFIYSNSEHFTDSNINAYVGGDAYNFIINSNLMVAYFVLALLFAIVACTIILVEVISELKVQN